jgi:hypothetical protein
MQSHEADDTWIQPTHTVQSLYCLTAGHANPLFYSPIQCSTPNPLAHITN